MKQTSQSMDLTVIDGDNVTQRCHAQEPYELDEHSVKVCESAYMKHTTIRHNN